MDSPRLLCRDSNIYNISGKQNHFVLEPYYDEETEDVAYSFSTNNTSYVITEWKKGGGLDRNTIGTYLEDWRYNAGYAFFSDIFRDEEEIPIRLFFDKLIPKRGKLNADTDVPEQTIDERTFLLPIRVTPKQGTDNYVCTAFELEFYVDYNNWEVIGDNFAGGGAGNVAAILPTERVWSKDGFGILAPVAGSQVVYDNTDGRVNIQFTIGNVVNPNFAGMVLTPNNKNNIIYIPIKQKNNRPSMTNSPIYLVNISNWTFRNPRGFQSTGNVNAYVWQNGYVTYRLGDEQAQFVDWCYKSAQFGLEDQNQIKSRGTYATMVSRGSSTNPLYPITNTFPYGLYNSIVGSDYKDYVTQLIDVTNTPGLATDLQLITQKNTTRNRAVNNLGVLTTKTFDNQFIYGNTAVPAEGNLLVDAQEVDTISTSDSTRGETVNYTLFGFIKNKAEKIILNTLRAVLMPVGGRRRRGR